MENLLPVKLERERMAKKSDVEYLDDGQQSWNASHYLKSYPVNSKPSFLVRASDGTCREFTVYPKIWMVNVGRPGHVLDRFTFTLPANAKTATLDSFLAPAAKRQ